MNLRIRHILEEARKLSPEERQDLRELMDFEFADDASDGTPDEIEAAWVDEVAKRIEKAERGEGRSIPAELVMAGLRAKIDRVGRKSSLSIVVRPRTNSAILSTTFCIISEAVSRTT